MRSDIIDRTGQRYGTLVVIERAEPKRYAGRGRYTTWKIRCDCGYEGEVGASDLRKGQKSHMACLLRAKVDPSAVAREKRALHKKLGLCSMCSTEAEKGKSRCLRHLEFARKDTARRKALRKQEEVK